MGKGYARENDTLVKLTGPEEVTESAGNVLDELVREGARRMLQSALEEEVQTFINRHKALTTEDGKQAVVRNGHLPERDVVTGVGPLRIKKPRVRDKQGGLAQRLRVLDAPRFVE